MAIDPEKGFWRFSRIAIAVFSGFVSFSYLADLLSPFSFAVVPEAIKWELPGLIIGSPWFVLFGGIVGAVLGVLAYRVSEGGRK